MLSKIRQNQKQNLVSSHMDNLNFNIHLCVYMYVCFYMHVFVGHKTTKGRGHECGGIVLILYTLFSVGGVCRGQRTCWSLFPLSITWRVGLQRSEDSLPDSILSSIVCPRGQTCQKIP